MTASLKYVVDASVGIKKFIIEPLTSKVNQLFAHLSDPDAQLYIPDLFYIECTNIAWKYIRAGLYNSAEAQQQLANLGHWQGHGQQTFPEELLPLRLFKCRMWLWLVVPGLRDAEPTKLVNDNRAVE